MKLKLSHKIVLIVLFPATAFLSLAGLFLWENLQETRESRAVGLNVQFLKSLTAFVSNVQKERGMSSGYLSGGIALQSLIEQRTRTDQTKADFLARLQGARLSPGTRELTEKIGVAVESARTTVDRKGTVPEVIKLYSNGVSTSLDVEVAIANETRLPVAAAKVRSIAVLSAAKESAGQLRANMVSILSVDKALDQQQFAKITNLKADIDSNLNSRALVIESGTREKIAALPQTPHWQEVQSTFQTVLVLSESGGYKKDPKEFFATISKCVDDVDSLISGELIKTESMADEIGRAAESSFTMVTIFIAAVASVLTIMTLYAIRLITRPLQNTITNLDNMSGQLAGEADSIASLSTELSESSTEQAASLQETAAAINEVNAMVQRNAESSKVSLQFSGESQSSLEQGRRSLDQLLDSIVKINSCNQQIVNQTNQNAGRMSDIANVISQIESQTKVIHDIVFQTKLLSFNASVEAARAGEYGKGFSVVAEEVGKLAEMSGNAAQQISAMISRSVETVHKIAEETRLEVGKLIENSAATIRDGDSNAKKCGEVFDILAAQAGKVHQMLGQIAAACQEQAQGVNEINTAIGQLDQTTQANAQVAEKSAVSSEELSAQAKGMADLVAQLQIALSGQNRSYGPSHRDLDVGRDHQNNDGKTHRLAA